MQQLNRTRCKYDGGRQHLELCLYIKFQARSPSTAAEICQIERNSPIFCEVILHGHVEQGAENGIVNSCALALHSDAILGGRLQHDRECAPLPAHRRQAAYEG